MDRHVCQNCILVFSSACAWLTRRLTNVKVRLAVSRFMLASLVRILRGQITKKKKKIAVALLSWRDSISVCGFTKADLVIP